MSWRKYLLVPGLALQGLGRTPPPEDAWDTYWAAVERTGQHGDVLWDGAGRQESQWWHEAARTWLDPSLPVLDLGCGNGRLARLLAAGFPAGVLGVDVSAAAVALAQRESVEVPGVRFRAMDVTGPGAAATIAEALGSEARGGTNVVVRGVFHVLDDAARQATALALGGVVGDRGTLLLLETNWSGDLLGYLEHLGARAGRLPDALRRVLDGKLPRPSAFGPAELARTFPADRWVTVATGPVGIEPVVLPEIGRSPTIPGFYAVLRTASAAEPAGAGPAATEQGI